METVDDDDKFAKEEKWLEDIRGKTLILTFRAKDYILKSKEEQDNQDKRDESANHGVNASETQTTQESSKDDANTLSAVVIESQTQEVNTDGSPESVESTEEIEQSVPEVTEPIIQPVVQKIEENPSGSSRTRNHFIPE